MNDSIRLAGIVPRWPAPNRVHAFSSMRTGGASRGPWQSFNLAGHVADDPEAVRRNRVRLRHGLGLPEEPRWLLQRHTARVVKADVEAPKGGAGDGGAADGIVSRAPGVVCAVLTADCLPILLCDRNGAVVAAVHAGWRGVAAGVVEAGVRATEVPPPVLMAWLGPAIGPEHYEVGAEVRNAALAGDPEADGAFRPTGPGRWQADLARLVRRRLARAGVRSIYGGGWCTASDPGRFFSYRRDGRTGRMATLIWIA